MTEPATRAESVSGLAIYGARAREDSDLDVLIEVATDSGFSLLNLIGVEHIIRDATGLRGQPYDAPLA